MENIVLNDKNESGPKTDITMSVSSVIKKDGAEKVFVLFRDSDKMIEFAIPNGKIMMNSGFTEKEVDKLRKYISDNQEYIFSIAKKVNPMKAFLGTI